MEAGTVIGHLKPRRRNSAYMSLKEFQKSCIQFEVLKEHNTV